MNFSEDPINTIENLVAKNRTKSVSLYLVVIVSISILLACLPFIKIDISSQSRGIIRAQNEDAPIISLVSGKVIYHNLFNNQIVYKGDTLLIVTTAQIHHQKLLNDSLREHVQEHIDDLTNLLKGEIGSIKTNDVKTKYQDYIATKKTLIRKADQAKRIYNRNKGLYKKKVISKQLYESYLYDLNAARDEIKAWKNRNIANWTSTKHSLEERLTNLKTQKEQLDTQISDYHITASTSGTLTQVFNLESGSNVVSNQSIGIISPNTNLIVETSVSPKDIGLLKINQKVTYQFDAFNYNQWGMLNGKILDIDKNITRQNNTAFFKVRCSLDHRDLQLKNGYKAYVDKGMTLTARFFLVRRSLFDLLFDKVDDWLNPKLIEVPN